MADKLTALQVERAFRKATPLMLSDGAGLYLRRQPGQEQASWVFRYRLGRRTRWLTLGQFPDMGLSDARKRARQARVDLDDGKDPRQRLRAERLAANERGSFAELAREWLTAEVEGSLKHPEIVRRHVEKHLIPALRNCMADEIAAVDIVRVLDRVKKAAPTVANDLLRTVRRIFAFGVRRHLVTTNPTDGLTAKRDAGGDEAPRARALRRDELRKLFEAMREAPQFGAANQLAVKLLLALCVRKTELLAARWAQFDLDGGSEDGPVWRLPGESTRKKPGLDIPLCPIVVGWLRDLKVLAGGSEYLFPRRRGHKSPRAKHISPDTINAALASLDHKLEHFVVHDLRRSSRTLLSALGVRSEVAERCLAHALRGIEKVYNRHGFFEERQAALTMLAVLIDDLEHGGGKVTPLRREAS